MGMLAGLGSLGMGIGGMLAGSPASHVQTPQMWQMPWQTSAAQGALGGIQGLGQYNTYNIPKAQQITHGLVNNPYASAYQGGANVAGPLGQSQALGQYGVGQGLTALGAGTLPAWAGTVMNTAMDPQSALYARTLQQVQDQAGAQNAMAGVGTTPYGAGLTNMATTNFNIDWQNQQLQRQLAGLQGAGGALGTGANIAQTGQGMAAAAPGQYLTSSAIPYSTYGAIGQGQLSALTGMGQFGQQAANIPQMQLQDYLNYINAGTGATGAATGVGQLGLNQVGMGFGQNMANLGLGMYGAGRIGGAGYGVPGFGMSTGWGNTGGFNSPFMTGGWGY